MHDSFGMAKVQCSQKLVHVEPNLVITERGIKDFEIFVVDMLEDQAGGFRFGVADNI